MPYLTSNLSRPRPTDPSGPGPSTLTEAERNYLLSVGALGKTMDRGIERDTIDVGRLLSLGRSDFYNGLASRGVFGQPNVEGIPLGDLQATKFGRSGFAGRDTRPLAVNFPSKQSGSLFGRLASVFSPALSILGGVTGLQAALGGFPSLGIGGLGDILGKSAAPAVKGISAAVGAAGSSAGAALPSAGGLGAALAARSGGAIGSALPSAGGLGSALTARSGGAAGSALPSAGDVAGVAGRAAKIAGRTDEGVSLLDILSGAGTALSAVGSLTGLGSGGKASLPTPNEPPQLAPAIPGIQRKFTVPEPMTAPAFLRLSSQMTPLQQRAAIATNALYGSPAFRDPQAAQFLTNLALRSLVGPNGELAQFENVLPVEREFAAQVLGSPLREDSTAGFLDALLRGQTQRQ